MQLVSLRIPVSYIGAGCEIVTNFGALNETTPLKAIPVAHD